MHKKALLFDLDDTLLHSVSIKWAQHQEIARRFYGIELDETTLRKHWGKPSKVLVNEFYGDSEPVEIMVEKFHSLNDQFPKTVVSRAVEVIEKVSGRGYVVGIVTNARKASVEHDLRRLDFPIHNLRFIHTYEDTGHYKPDPAAFSKAINLLRKEDIKDITYVGDSIIDWQAATGAGLKFIGVTSGITTKEELKAVGAKNIIKTLEELLTILR